jgi:UDP-GlcNAc:undecaprenyl-phosphate/decaprenyl-phosphate GlcNAc-1-phosphate transferase
MYKWACIILGLLLVENLYFKIAIKFKIIDKPNERSSHSKNTIRGGGIIFPISLVLFYFLENPSIPYFFIGLILISSISFWDDIKSLPNKVRLFFQFASIGMLVFQIYQVDATILYFSPLILILFVGILNAYNFMDGINGLTGFYSLISILTLWYINETFETFVQKEFFYYILVGLIIFNYYNFRKKAVCFGGDVGSISMGFIIIFLIFSLIIYDQDLKYIFLLYVYGLDVIYTLIYRIIKKENIFEAHRVHTYQILVHQFSLGHLKTSIIYTFAQLIINSVLLVAPFYYTLIISLIFLTIMHLIRTKKDSGIYIR